MADRYPLSWIDRDAESGPIFQVGRDVYERAVPGGRVIWLEALETYPGYVAPRIAEAFGQCAEAWGAPIVFVIDPNLLKPPAVRFLFEWSRTTHSQGSVEQCFMKTSSLLTQWMGRIVLRVFTDGSMPFRAVQGDEAMRETLDQLDLAAPQPGFELRGPTTALVPAGQGPQTLLGSIVQRAVRRARRLVG